MKIRYEDGLLFTSAPAPDQRQVLFKIKLHQMI